MKIVYNGSNEKVKEAVGFTNELFEIEEFWDEIRAMPQFDCTNLSTQEIVQIILECDAEVKIRTYRPWWRWSKANAYVDRRYPNTLFLNSRKFWRSTESMVNTIVHECVHIADYGDDDSKVRFGHGNNSSAGKQKTAPYWIGSKAEKYYLKMDVDPVEIEKIHLDDALIDR